LPLYRAEQVGPAVRVIKGVHQAKLIRDFKAVVRLVHVRVVGFRVHEQDVPFLIQQIIHQGERKRLLPTPPLLPPT
jgi:hypothetical protein